MRRAWAKAKGGLAALALVTALGAAPAAPAAAQEEGRPAANGPSRKVIRTKRLRVPADLFERDAVFFKRARVEAGGRIRADGHDLDLYGMELIRRNRICAPEGGRWACGQRAFMAMRGLLEGQSISCSFIAAAGSPKAVCWVGDNDVTQWSSARAGRSWPRVSPTRATSKLQPPRGEEGRHLGRRSAVIRPMGSPISAELAKKSREPAIKAHPKPASSEPMHQDCIAKGGNMPN